MGIPKVRAGGYVGQGVGECPAAHSINPPVSGSWVVWKVLEEEPGGMGGWGEAHGGLGTVTF